jgi:hypothetical protein
MCPRSYTKQKGTEIFSEKRSGLCLSKFLTPVKKEKDAYRYEKVGSEVAGRESLGSSIALPPWPIYYRVSFLSTFFLLLTPGLHGQPSVLRAEDPSGRGGLFLREREIRLLARSTPSTVTVTSTEGLIRDMAHFIPAKQGARMRGYREGPRRDQRTIPFF